MDLVVRLIADRMNLRTESLAGGSRILIQQRLDIVVVFLKQRPDPFLLRAGQFQILRQMI